MSEENITPQSAQPESKPAVSSAPKPVLKKPVPPAPAAKPAAVSAAKPAAAPAAAKPTIKIGAKPAVKVPRIDLAAKTADEAAQPVPAKPAGEADLGTLKQAMQKTSAQIDSARKELQKPAAPADKKGTMFMDVESMESAPKPPAVEQKKQTSRISTASAVPPPAKESLDEFTPAPPSSLAKNATMFMNIDDDLGEAPGKHETKKQTARIDVSSAMPSARETGRIGETPATIKIKRPVTTTTARKPPARPPEPMLPHSVLSQQPAPSMVSEGKKSETSRIELPPDAARPPTRKKTVKIKRPDGSDMSSPKLTLARPLTSSFQAAQVELPAKLAQEEAGMGFSIVSIAATIVIGVLVYVFMAQVLANGLPFPSPIN
ncbi:MAG: hypothetical protein AB7T27_12605 [Kiritimatiellia bacterium]